MIRIHSTVRLGLPGSPVASKSFDIPRPQFHFELSMRSSIQDLSQRRCFTSLSSMQSLARASEAHYARHPESQRAYNHEKYFQLSSQDHFDPKQLEAQRRWRKSKGRRWRMGWDATSYGRTLLEAAIPYQARFKPLLDVESAIAKQTHEERLSNWPLEKIIEYGYALTDLQAVSHQYVPKNSEEAESEATKSKSLVLRFSSRSGLNLPFNELSRGVPVTVVPNDQSPLDVSMTVDGTVIYSSSTEIWVKIENLDPRRVWRDKAQIWRLDLGYNDIAYSRCLVAIDLLQFDPGLMENRSTDKTEYPLRGTHLRSELLGAYRPNGTSWDEENRPRRGIFTYYPELLDWARRYSVADPIKEPEDPEILLNGSQIRAIALMLQRKISLIQGPPGTGKTRTITEFVRLLKGHFKVSYPLLICAHTNVAVDNLVRKLTEAGLKPLRVSSEGNVGEDISKWTMQTLETKHPKAKELAELQDKLNVLEAECTSYREEDIEKQERLSKPTQNLEGAIGSLQREIRKDVFDQADAIYTTSIMAGSFFLNWKDFPIVFQDEASMSTEPISLIPLMRGCEHLCLIGDHKQLPSVVISEEARTGGLSKSLFERLIENSEVPSIMLDTQYRMHPGISAFPSIEFYDSTLQDDTVHSKSIKESPLYSSYFDACKARSNEESISTVFIHHDHTESMQGQSRTNYGDIAIVISIVEDLLLKNTSLKGTDIGIIAPYLAQIRYLHRVFRQEEQWTAYFKESLGDERAMEVRDIEIKTVDGFQGREKEVIIFSTVRNNPFGHIGFLAEQRRMNVALTRAKRGLFVIGNMGTLSKPVENASKDLDIVGGEVVYTKGKEWPNYVKFVTERGLHTEYHHPIDYGLGEPKTSNKEPPTTSSHS